MEAHITEHQPAFIVPVGLLTFALLVILVFLGVYQMESPSVAGVDAPATTFSAIRAMQHLEVIAQNPHPLGSAENAKVREYIVSNLTEHGFQPEIQTREVSRTINFVSRQTGQPTQRTLSGTVNNIMIRLDGTDSNNALLIAAHYDSADRGPGASDDGAGVAAMLETLRALRAGSAPRNDIIFLFTDGEERGLLGAKAFVETHPWARDVKVALNFEARGTTGPSYMFETSDNNGWLISQFARAAAYPVGYSFTYDIYKMLPNDTDLTMFRGANMAGMNFAFIDGFVHYHMPSDTLANLNPRSLQHHGVSMLSLARHFGDIPLDNTSATNHTYFGILGLIVHYSQALNFPLVILVALVFVAVVVLGLRRQRLSFKGLVGGFFTFLLITIASLLGVFVLSFIPSLMNAQPINPLNGSTYNWHFFAISYMTLALAITSALYAWFRQRVRLNNLIVGALLWWLLMMVVTAFLLPGTTYLFTWPLLLSLIALAVRFMAQAEDSPIATLLLILLPAISGILLVTPLIRGVFVALSLNLYVPMLLFPVLLFGLLLPHLTLMTTRHRWAFPILAAIVGLNLLVFAGLTAGVGA
jgi:hypothetical protein